jgi:hypothetical protein
VAQKLKKQTKKVMKSFWRSKVIHRHTRHTFVMMRRIFLEDREHEVIAQTAHALGTRLNT